MIFLFQIFTSLFLIVSGQVVSSEILMASEHGCPIEMHRIPIEKCDEMFDEECTGESFMPFHRANYDRRTGQSPNSPREQVRLIFSRIFGFITYVLIYVDEMRPGSGSKTNYSVILKNNKNPTRNILTYIQS